MLNAYEEEDEILTDEEYAELMEGFARIETTEEDDEEPFDEQFDGIALHNGQTQVYDALFLSHLFRFVVVSCARGWGKSYMAAVAAVTAIFELLELNPKVPNKIVYIVAPTYDQVTDIYFPLIAYDLGMEEHCIRSSRDLGRFVFPNNVELRLLSYEAVERMRGKGAYLVVWDEISSCKKGISAREAWQAVMQPCVVTRWSEERARAYGAISAGRLLAISTPKGYNFFHTLSTYRENDPRWGFFHFDYKQSPYIDPEEIEKIRHNIDPVEFASEYLANFEESGNSVFYCFDRKIHVQKGLQDFYPPQDGEKGEDIHVCVDFNVGIMAASFFALRGKQMQFLDEMKGHPDTEELCKAIAIRYKGHRVFVYPDPTGNARKSSAAVGRTDFSIIRSYGFGLYARGKSPAIIDSVACVNKQLKTAAGDVNMFFHPRCQGTITSMERTKWVDRNQDTASIDKSENLEHFSDGVRYATEWLFPITAGVKKVSRGFKF